MLLNVNMPREANGTTRANGIPGSNIISTAAAGLGADAIRYSFFGITKPVTITDIIGNVTTAPAAATQLGIAIYEANENYQPTVLIGSQIFNIPAATGGFSQSGLRWTLSKGNGTGIYFVAVNTGAAMSVQCYNTPGLAVPNANLAQMVNRSEATPVTMASLVAAGGFPQNAILPTALIPGSEAGQRHPCVFKYLDL